MDSHDWKDRLEGPRLACRNCTKCTVEGLGPACGLVENCGRNRQKASKWCRRWRIFSV